MSVADVSASRTDIPDHVPDSLVLRWALATAPGVENDPYAANIMLQKDHDIFYSPLMRSPTDPGAWVITRSALIREAFLKPSLFINKDCSGLATLVGGNWDLIPLEIDAPDHLKYRVLLNPLFTPKRMATMEADIRKAAVDLIEKVKDQGCCEFDSAFAHPFPASIFLTLLGLPLDMTDQFVEWELTLLRAKTFEIRAEAAKAVRDYLVDIIEQRRKSPTGDLVSFATQATVEGRPLTDDEILGICFLLFVGGLDTVTSTMGFIFKHLAENPEIQQRLRENPELIDKATEEYLRAFAVVNSPRHVAEDTVFHGVHMKKGDRVILAMTLGGRDEAEYADADVIDLDRKGPRHMSFATGPHNCIGQHLARREIRVALEEWLARVPTFGIKPGEKPVTQGMTVFGVDYLPLVWPVAE